MSVSSLPSRSLAGTSPSMASRSWVAICAAGRPRSAERVRSTAMVSSGLGGFESILMSTVPGSVRSVSATHLPCSLSTFRSGPVSRTMIG